MCIGDEITSHMAVVAIIRLPTSRWTTTTAGSFVCTNHPIFRIIHCYIDSLLFLIDDILFIFYGATIRSPSYVRITNVVVWSPIVISATKSFTTTCWFLSRTLHRTFECTYIFLASIELETYQTTNLTATRTFGEKLKIRSETAKPKIDPADQIRQPSILVSRCALCRFLPMIQIRNTQWLPESITVMRITRSSSKYPCHTCVQNPYPTTATTVLVSSITLYTFTRNAVA